MTELTKRLIFGFIAVPAVIFITLNGGIPFTIFALILFLGGGIEFYLMLKKKDVTINLPVLLLGIALIALYSSELTKNFQQYFLPALLIFFFIITFAEVLKGEPEKAVIKVGASLLGIIYIGLLGSFIISIPNHPAHLEMNRFGLITLFLAVWGSDTFAYILGKFFGKKLLMPKISPKKTIMGFIGSLIGAIMGMLIGRSLFSPLFPSIYGALVIGIVIGTIGQAGDLFESVLKRSCGVKDSSKILPGHGGILDRIDALLFCAPVYYYLLFIFD